MPALQCSARTCVYNKGELCSKGDIKVGGGGATRADETCCESFMERKDTMSNSMTTADTGCGCTTVGISCDAKSCKSNDHCRCIAGAVNIEGTDACTVSETCCGSFMCR